MLALALIPILRYEVQKFTCSFWHKSFIFFFHIENNVWIRLSITNEKSHNLLKWYWLAYHENQLEQASLYHACTFVARSWTAVKQILWVKLLNYTCRAAKLDLFTRRTCSWTEQPSSITGLGFLNILLLCIC